MTYEDRIIRGEMIVYFIDECHVLGDTAVSYGWAPSDQRINVLVKMIMIDKPILVR